MSTPFYDTSPVLCLVGKNPDADDRVMRGLSRLRQDMLRSTRSLRRVQLKSDLELEIILALAEGERSIGELVEIIFDSRSSDPGFDTHYMRVYRASQDLASRGFVARRLFGREKPYRLTGYCIEKLFAGPGAPSPRMVTALEFILYLSTLICGAVMALVGVSVLDLGIRGLIIFNSLFFFLLGFSSLRMLQNLRRVG
jgi:hypothetical protein